jgi:hypothetical protein
MKVYRFHQQARIALNPPPGLLVALRHGKIMINTLLRWCSAGLISSYILTITAGIYFSNQLTLLSGWLPNLILALLVLLFACLLYVQYRYSEKRIENCSISDNDVELNSFYVGVRYKTNQRLTLMYVIAVLATSLLMAIIIFSGQQAVTGLLMMFGLTLYGCGLLMIRGLLKEKCAIRQMINKFGPF